jgi:antitoxin (DNA-binding transcriptional repressor) of toxin-antitoxin stability system
MVRRITISEASTQFSELADRVKNSGDEFVVERDGQALCRISPAPAAPFTIADMVELLRSLEPPDPEYFDAVEEYVRNQPPVPPSPWDS